MRSAGIHNRSPIRDDRVISVDNACTLNLACRNRSSGRGFLQVLVSMMCGMLHRLHIHESETFCLEHQRPEDRPSSRGLLCAECHARLIEAPPQGAICSYWESQPAAYTLQGDPCWVYTLVWSDFRIRSLHWNGQQGLPKSTDSVGWVSRPV